MRQFDRAGRPRTAPSSTRRTGVGLALFLLLAAAGCGAGPASPAPDPQTGSGRPEASSAPAAGPPSASPGVTMSDPSTDPGVPTPITTDLPGVGAVTLTGTVTEGVERGCVVLTDGTGTALATLLGFDTVAHPFGSAVTVTGRWARDRVSICQQGPLLEVRSVSG